MKEILEQVDKKISETIINFIYIVFGVFAIVVSYIFSFLTSSKRR